MPSFLSPHSHWTKQGLSSCTEPKGRLGCCGTDARPASFSEVQVSTLRQAQAAGKSLHRALKQAVDELTPKVP